MSTSEDLPERIGRYRILRELGRGGMGVVFEAEQDSPRRLVALKVVSVGIQSREARQRFELEAAVLGHLQHPCIAQVYDAGVHVGAGGVQPWFAMELVRGVPLDRYARERNLDTRARLALLARVCDGVQHAHQRGVIHRDLKPANVLVDEEGAPKILDFGLARATDADLQTASLHTTVGQIMGTVPYMSPEQAAGDPAGLDARTDVYSLGVVAYQLLSGAMPYAADGPQILEALRVVREEDPRPLSSIDRALRGDVETIVGKALEKEPSRRYDSASALADDIRRFLDDQPIAARRPSAGYQLRKFARRNKALVGGVAAVFVALVLGLIGTARGYFAAREEAESARLTADFLQTILSGVDPAVAQGADTTLFHSILDDTAARIGDEFAGRPAVEARIRRAMASAYFAIAEFEPALEQARAAAELAAREHGADSVEALGAACHVPLLLNRLGRVREARAGLEAHVERCERILGPEHPESDTARGELGVLLLEANLYDEAAPTFERVLAWRRAHLAPDAEPLLIAVNCLGLARIKQRRFEEAEELLLEALEGRRRRGGERHPETIKALQNLGGLYSTAQRNAEAEELYRRSLELAVEVLGEDHEGTFRARDNLAQLLRNTGRREEALALQLADLEGLRARFGADDPRTLVAESELTLPLLDLGRLEDAERYAVHASAGLLEHLGPEHPSVLVNRSYLARIASARGRPQEAERARRELLETLTRLRGEDDKDALIVRGDLGAQLLNEARYDEAEPLLERALEGKRRALGTGDLETQRSVWALAVLRRAQERYPDSLPLLGEFLATWPALMGDDETYSARAAADLEDGLARVEPLGPFEGTARTLLSFRERAGPPSSLPSALVLHGEALLDLDRAEEAAAELERALELYSERDTPPPRALSAYGAALLALGRLDEARDMLLAAWEDAPESPPDEKRRVARRLVELEDAAAKPDDAEHWRAELAALER